MDTVVLNQFELLELPVGSTLDAALSAASTEWIAVAVPGSVHEALIAAGRIEHPYFGVNERDSAWIEERDWWYRTTFAVPEAVDADERVRLVFDGLDTVADVWLNGIHMGSHRNTFREAVHDVSRAIATDNELLIRFSPPLQGLEVPPVAAAQAERLQAMMGAALGNADADERTNRARATQRRKAPMSWGWDIGPNIPNIGIWRSVTLRRERRAVITGHHVRTTLHEDGSATATVLVEADAFGWDGELSAHVVLQSPSGTRFEASVDVKSGSGDAVFEIADPELWWTHDLGQPHLHDLTIVLTAGEIVDELTDRIGLRTLDLDRGDDVAEGGRFFTILLNRIPLYVRGASWVPTSVFIGSVAEETYRDRIQLARDGNLNMLRIWGGGIYENDAFYAVCDELGVALWHDFIFACNDYPSDDAELIAEVTAEADYQVTRLRNHPSIALWVGNNEVQVIHSVLYQSLDGEGWGDEFFMTVLPDAVRRIDGTVPYWPGSPYGEVVGDESVFEAVSGMLDGDSHSWSVWHGATMEAVGEGQRFATAGEAMHYRRYREEKAKFVSEFGIHSAPALSTLQKWLPASELTVHSAAFDLHNKDHPKNKGDALLELVTGLPETLAQHVEFSQLTQAEGMAFGIEHLRRRQPHTSGALVWNFNDIWPGSSWAIVDYEGAPKAAYFAVRRASAPVALSFVETDAGTLELWAVNSSPNQLDTTVEVEVGTFDGAERTATPVDCAIPALASIRLWESNLSSLAGSAHHYVWASSAHIGSARHHFAAPKDLDLRASRLESTVERTAAGDARVHLVSTGYAYMAHIASPNGSARFSENYVDLRDGDRLTITVSGVDGVADDMLVARASVVPVGKN